jgi:hypothetical protein
MLSLTSRRYEIIQFILILVEINSCCRTSSIPTEMYPKYCPSVFLTLSAAIRGKSSQY